MYCIVFKLYLYQPCVPTKPLSHKRVLYDILFKVTHVDHWQKRVEAEGRKILKAEADKKRAAERKLLTRRRLSGGKDGSQ